MPIELPAMLTEQQEAWQAVAERDHLANMLGRLSNEPELMEQVSEGAEGVERLRISLN
ncbi:hypothetical protein J2Y41_002434 [Arthrobacter sp. 1088]|uniref:hypothetical protein n=1 Tax=Arthrobacter sp. 1088 TaxID=2817768 RepID=UPI00285D8E80|nr:hypothetical protein [Arthrobacter sp. 1088]MDR6686873.1 hypothetical protein [Arthrobacter sp. 1088]